MGIHVLLALGLVLVFEGILPMFFPRIWRRMVLSLAQLPDNTLRRIGGGIVVAGCVIYYMLRGQIGNE